jgi:hypothetical protein
MEWQSKASVVHTVILATWEAEIRRISGSGPAQANNLRNLISKIPRVKWTVGVAQVVEHEALSEFKPQSHKKRGEKKWNGRCGWNGI